MNIQVKDSFIAGLINGAINGYIASHHFKGMSSVPMSMEMISNSQVTVWGQAISLTFGLGIILSLITSTLFLRQLKISHPQYRHELQRSFWKDLLPIALMQAGALFGWFVALAVIWTKYAGVVMVSPMAAVVLTGLFAFVITIVVEVRTKSCIIYKKVNILEQKTI
ncbi:TPA: permease [Vibrio vulnificus]|uniref:permease n=1 Tax=Vibrio vulnificus TaxID=672 RepID=UPI000CD2C2AA|nr:permease [Vibrio vulnificus]AVX01872.1 permease [Vibrio vulnificus Env1]EGQ8022752.1 permease [Vibrio vulnificus]EGQ9291787.1 permease [Vibrio vulnificus]EHH1185081.1 permease [Vibrio vulnificus]EHH2475631.1 permease [Vibrio vulnificus]